MRFCLSNVIAPLTSVTMSVKFGLAFMTQIPKEEPYSLPYYIALFTPVKMSVNHAFTSMTQTRKREHYVMSNCIAPLIPVKMPVAQQFPPLANMTQTTNKGQLTSIRYIYIHKDSLRLVQLPVELQ